jgi:polyhydroxyalkanoate synthase
LQRGVRDVLDAVSRTVPEQKAHLLGFAMAARCSSVAAAALAAQADQGSASHTLLAAQSDFSEPGVLSLVISLRQIAMRKEAMQRRGVRRAKGLRTTELSGGG